MSKEIEDIVLNLMPKILKKAHDRPYGMKRLRSKLYWLSVIDSVESIVEASRQDNRESLILDIGCGIGFMSKIFSNLGFHVVGIDTRFNVVWKDPMLGGCNFIQSDGLHLPFSKNKFSCIGAFAILEHVEDNHMLLSEINRVLKVDGVLCVSQLPSFLGLTEIHRRAMRSKFHRYYKKKEIQLLLEKHGFKLIHLSYDHFLPQFLPFDLLNVFWNRWARFLYRADSFLSLLPFSHSFNIICRKVG